MEQVCVQLTVLFEEPFWIGLCERRGCARQEEAERRFALRQDKRREKHRGH